MKKAYWIDGRLLTERRRQLEGFKRVTAISDEMMRNLSPEKAAELAAREYDSTPRSGTRYRRTIGARFAR
jgi:hypothetical protein